MLDISAVVDRITTAPPDEIPENTQVLFWDSPTQAHVGVFRYATDGCLVINDTDARANHGGNHFNGVHLAPLSTGTEHEGRALVVLPSADRDSSTEPGDLVDFPNETRHQHMRHNRNTRTGDRWGLRDDTPVWVGPHVDLTDVEAVPTYTANFVATTFTRANHAAAGPAWEGRRVRILTHETGSGRHRGQVGTLRGRRISLVGGGGCYDWLSLELLDETVPVSTAVPETAPEETAQETAPEFDPLRPEPGVTLSELWVGSRGFTWLRRGHFLGERVTVTGVNFGDGTRHVTGVLTGIEPEGIHDYPFRVFADEGSTTTERDVWASTIVETPVVDDLDPSRWKIRESQPVQGHTITRLYVTEAYTDTPSVGQVIDIHSRTIERASVGSWFVSSVGNWYRGAQVNPAINVGDVIYPLSVSSVSDAVGRPSRVTQVEGVVRVQNDPRVENVHGHAMPDWVVDSWVAMDPVVPAPLAQAPDIHAPDVDDERLAARKAELEERWVQLWQVAGAKADEQEWCGEYDRIVQDIGGIVDRNQEEEEEEEDVDYDVSIEYTFTLSDSEMDDVLRGTEWDKEGMDTQGSVQITNRVTLVWTGRDPGDNIDGGDLLSDADIEYDDYTVLDYTISD